MDLRPEEGVKILIITSQKNTIQNRIKNENCIFKNSSMRFERFLKKRQKCLTPLRRKCSSEAFGHGGVLTRCCRKNSTIG